jgi:hypothetical protein
VTSTPTARATVTPPAPGVELSHGFAQLRDFGVQPSGTPAHTFRMVQQPYGSYEVVVDAPSGDLGPGLLLRRIAPDGVTVLQDAQPVSGLDFAQSLRWRHESSTAAVDEFIRVQSASCAMSCGADDVYRIRAYETTYRAPRFNNSGTQITVLVLQNRDPAPISGAIHFWGAGGTLVASRPFDLGARESLVLNTSTVPGLPGVGGTLTLTHDGRYGALAGKAVALEPSTGFSFDTPLEPRPR